MAVEAAGSEVLYVESSAVENQETLQEKIEKEVWRWGYLITNNWQCIAVSSAIAIQVMRTFIAVIGGDFFSFLANGLALTGLFIGYNAAVEYQKLQSLEESTKNLQATNEALAQKLARLEAATDTLVTTISRFDDTTATYLKSLSAGQLSRDEEVKQLNLAVDAFSRLFEDATLADLWKETIEAVRVFEKANADYQAIQRAISVEREALSKLNMTLKETVGTLKEQGHNFDQLYDRYQAFLDQLLNNIGKTNGTS